MLQDAIQNALIELSKLYPNYNVEDEHNKDTARRIANVWIEMCEGYQEPNFEFTLFESKTSPQPVILKNISFHSYCIHHFLPFSGKVHIGYIPNKFICGLSKLPRAVEYIAKKPQIQEIMTDEIACFINNRVEPIVIVVIIEAEHTCVACRGIESQGAKMITKSVYADYSFSQEDLIIAEKKIMELMKDGL